MQRTLKLGTRGSLLAMAQSRQIASQLMRWHPGLDVQLHPVTTRGDRNQSTPLGKVDDPDFFSAELDSALLDGEIAFVLPSGLTSFKSLQEHIDTPHPAFRYFLFDLTSLVR